MATIRRKIDSSWEDRKKKCYGQLYQKPTLFNKRAFFFKTKGVPFSAALLMSLSKKFFRRVDLNAQAFTETGPATFACVRLLLHPLPEGGLIYN